MTKQNPRRRRFRKGNRTLRLIAHHKRVLARFNPLRCACRWKYVADGTHVRIKCEYHTARAEL